MLAHPTAFILVDMKDKHKIVDEKVQVGKGQEKEQSEKDSHSKNRDGKKVTIRYLYHENIS